MNNYTFKIISADGTENEVMIKSRSTMLNISMLKKVKNSLPENAINGTLFIPEGIEIIDNVFMARLCDDIKEIRLSSTVEKIYRHAFFFPLGVEKIFVDENNQHFSSDENGVLYNKDKTIIVRYPIGRNDDCYEIPPTVTEIAPFAFAQAKVKFLSIPKSVSVIGEQAFMYSQIISADFSSESKIEALPKECFWGCSNLINISLPKCLKSIGSKCFCQSGLDHICLPDSVNKMGSYAFLSCKKLKDIYVPRDLKTIPRSCFQECESLERIYISSSVIRIHKTAFRNCPSLSDIITVHNKEFATVDGILYNKDFTKLLKVPSNKFDDSGRFEIPSSVISIDEAAFDSCENLVELDIGNAELQDSSIFNCPNLKKIIIGADYCKKFSFDKIKLCFALEEITVKPENPYYKSIDGVLFDRSGEKLILYPPAKKETIYTVPNGVQKISRGSFYNAKYLKSVKLPETIRFIEEQAFEHCDNLESINLANVISIGIRAFAFCEALINVDIGENANVGDYAFAFSGLKNVEGNISQNGVNAFMMTPYYENVVDFINSKEDELSSIFIEANIPPEYILAPRSYSRNYWGK